MQLEARLTELSKLTFREKLHVLRWLASDSAAVDDTGLTAGTTYAAWSPLDAPSAATTLTQLLEQQATTHE